MAFILPKSYSTETSNQKWLRNPCWYFSEHRWDWRNALTAENNDDHKCQHYIKWKEVLKYKQWENFFTNMFDKWGCRWYHNKINMNRTDFKDFDAKTHGQLWLHSKFT